MSMDFSISQLRQKFIIRLRTRLPLLHAFFKAMARASKTGRRICIEMQRKLFPKTWIRIKPPRNGFSEFEQLSECEKEKQTIVDNQGSPMIGERSMILQSNLRQHLEQPFPVFWRKISAARLVGTSLTRIDKSGRISDVYGKERFRNDPAYHYMLLSKPLYLEGPWTSIVSMWTPANRPSSYAHWLLDALPRLNLLNDFPSETQILVPARLSTFQKESLTILDVLERCRPTGETHVVLENYFYSSPPSMVVCWSPYSINFLRTHFLSHAATEASHFPRRFYLKRRRFRGVVNGQQLEEFFVRHGWAVVDAEDFSFREQIALFAQAEAICAVHGAGLANLAWCSPGCKVLEIFASSYLSGCYEWMAQCCQLSYDFIVCPNDANLNVIIDLKQLELHLKTTKML